MKRLVLLALLLLPGLAWSAPFLICDPPPAADQITRYEIAIGSATVSTPAPLHYDLTSVPAGAHTWQIKACSLWECSAAVPFAFTRPGKVGAPAGFGIVAN